MAKNIKTILVCGAGGFIGSHLVKRLKKQGHYVVGVDLKYPEWTKSTADKFIIGDLRLQSVCWDIFTQKFDEVYQLAADMGGAGYIFTQEHDADILYNSAQINLNIAKCCAETKVGKVFYSSSACVYRDLDTQESNANPDSEYGWEKLFSEHVYLSYKKNYGLNVKVARFHNIFGPEGTFDGGKEKAPAAICRKVIRASKEIKIWGDGEQTRSFLYIDECLDAVERLMKSSFSGPVNIGSDEMVSINGLAELAMRFKGTTLKIKHIKGPLGVRGRTSDNRLILKKLGWKPNKPLRAGLLKTYSWIKSQS